MYRPGEGWQIQDPIGNGDRATGLMEINDDMVRSMVERLNLVIFWHFSMVGAIYTTDLNQFLLGCFYLVFCVLY